MQTSTLTKFILATASALVLAACSTPKNTVGPQSQSGEANAATQTANSSAVETHAMQQSAGYQGGNDLQFAQNSMKAPSNQTYYFAFDQSGLKSEDMPFLRAQAAYLVAHPQASVRLEGNTDNRGSREYNVGLGWRRDQTVDRVLIQEGVSKNQIQMVSYGKEHPVALGDSPQAWSLNRRVNLIYKAY